MHTRGSERDKLRIAGLHFWGRDSVDPKGEERRQTSKGQSSLETGKKNWKLLSQPSQNNQRTPSVVSVLVAFRDALLTIFLVSPRIFMALPLAPWHPWTLPFLPHFLCSLDRSPSCFVVPFDWKTRKAIKKDKKTWTWGSPWRWRCCWCCLLRWRLVTLRSKCIASSRAARGPSAHWGNTIPTATAGFFPSMSPWAAMATPLLPGHFLAPLCPKDHFLCFSDFFSFCQKFTYFSPGTQFLCPSSATVITVYPSYIVGYLLMNIAKKSKTLVCVRVERRGIYSCPAVLNTRPLFHANAISRFHSSVPRCRGGKNKASNW